MPPPSDSVKLNVDGSFLESSNSIGAGGLIYSATGDWIVGFSSCEGDGDTFLAGLLPIKHSLLLAWSMNFLKLICESDALEVVNTLLDESMHVHHVYASVIAEVVQLMKRPWSVSLKHVYREVNGSADFLAKLGVRSKVLWQFWTDPPPGLGSLLLRDVLMCMPPT